MILSYFCQIICSFFLPPHRHWLNSKDCDWTLTGLSSLWLVYTFSSPILYCGTNVHAVFEAGWAACNAWGFDIQMGVFCLDKLVDLYVLILPLPLVSDYRCTSVSILRIVLPRFQDAIPVRWPRRQSGAKHAFDTARAWMPDLVLVPPISTQTARTSSVSSPSNYGRYWANAPTSDEHYTALRL